MTEETQVQPTQNDPDVTVTVKLSKLNLIIAGLDELPHKISRVLIDDLAQQAQAQLQQKQS